MRKPKVTVLMPVYNAEKYLREAIDSILNQTFKDFEFLIINDASTDNSKKIILSYKDPRVVYVENDKNLGVAKTLNKGLKLAKGKYIARMDADDISLPKRLEKQTRFMERNQKVGLLSSFWYLIDSQGNKILEPAFNGKYAVHFMCHGTVMIRMSFLQKISFYQEIFEYSEDTDLWLRLGEICDVRSLKEPLYMHRVHKESVSSIKRAEQILYASLAIKLAEERKKLQKGELYVMKTKEIKKARDKILKLSGIKKKWLISHTYFVYSYAAFKLGNYKMSFRYLRNAIEILLGYSSIKLILKRIFSKNWLIHEIEDKAIVLAIRKYAHGRLIDIGCGDKQYAEATKSYVTEHIGLDHKNTLHDKSKANIIGTAYDIPVENDHFDTVLCTFVLEHLEEPDKAIREAGRVLKKKGYAIYTVPLFWHLHEEPRDFYRFTRYGLKYLFEKNDFKIIELQPLSSFWVTFGQELVYYLWLLRKGGKINLLWWIIPIVGTIIQGVCFLLDKIHHPEQFSCEYLVVAQKIK